MSPITPTPQQLDAYAAFPDSGPVVMVNLLKFRAHAEGTDEPGEVVYGRYVARVAPLLAEVGGRPLWQGRVEGVFIGGGEDEWDRVLIVQYPSRAAFLRMIQSPAYQEASRDRTAALERTALLATTTWPPAQK